MAADLFHYGHMAFLERAAALRDYLLVGMHPDEAPETYRPHVTLCYRNQDVLQSLTSRANSSGLWPWLGFVASEVQGPV